MATTSFCSRKARKVMSKSESKRKWNCKPVTGERDQVLQQQHLSSSPSTTQPSRRRREGRPPTTATTKAPVFVDFSFSFFYYFFSVLLLSLLFSFSSLSLKSILMAEIEKSLEAIVELLDKTQKGPFFFSFLQLSTFCWSIFFNYFNFLSFHSRLDLQKAAENRQQLETQLQENTMVQEVEFP